MNYKELSAAPANYPAASVADYDLITAENVCKMKMIAGDSYDDALDFSACEYMAEYAEANGQVLRGHNLVWGAPASDDHNPPFIQGDDNSTAKIDFMKTYI